MSRHRPSCRVAGNGQICRLRPFSERDLHRWSSCLLILGFVAGSACGGEAVSIDTSTTEIAEDAYEIRRIDDVQPSLFHCTEATTSLLCNQSAIDAVVLADSNLYTFSDGSVRLSSGEEAPRLLARDGSGPGELRAPVAFGSDHNGGLLVFDFARMRLVSFGVDEQPSELSVFPPTYFRSPRIRAGELYALTLPPGDEYGGPVDAAILRFSVATETWSDTIARFSEPATSLPGSSEQFLMSLPWDRAILWDACDDGRVVLAHSDRWLVGWYAANTVSGDASARVTRPNAPLQPMTSEEHESLIADQLARMPISARSNPDKRLLERPRYRRVLDAVYCGRGGVAVLVNTPNFGDSSRTLDFVLDNGTLLGTARIPATFRILDAHEDKVFGFMTADDLSERFAQITIAP